MENDDSAADDIASAITKILVKAFTAKEGRDPTNEEVQMLIEELTEERIESMLNGLDEPAAEEKEEESGDEEVEDDKSVAEEGEESSKAAENVETAAESECAAVGSDSLKRSLARDEAKSDENGTNNDQNKKVRTSVAEQDDESAGEE
jgi:hypothetical protein